MPREEFQFRVVLDTNVLLSLWVFADSRYAPLRGLIESGRLMALCNQDCLGEFERVLGYPEFELTIESQRVMLSEYGGLVSMIAKPPPKLQFPLPQCRDEDDQKFLELARDGGADYLVTSDKALLVLARHRKLPQHISILTPDRFLGEMRPEVSIP